MSKGLFSLFTFIAALADARYGRTGCYRKPHEHPNCIRGNARAKEVAVSERRPRLFRNRDGTFAVSGRKCPGVVLHRKSYREACALGIAGV